MRKPTNTDEIPTVEERGVQEEAIFHLESVLASAPLLGPEQINALKEELKQRSAWIAPIRRIPFDILYQIFLLYCGTNWSAALLLAAVCRRWRQAIFSTPPVWSRISPYVRKNGTALPSAYIRAFLRRSKPCLLHIGIQQSPQSFDCRKVSNLLDCACKNARIILGKLDRIRCLAVEYECVGIIRTSELLNLDKLHIFSNEWPPSIPVPLDMSLLPRLQHLGIGNWEGINNPSISRAPMYPNCGF